MGLFASVNYFIDVYYWNRAAYNQYPLAFSVTELCWTHDPTIFDQDDRLFTAIAVPEGYLMADGWEDDNLPGYCKWGGVASFAKADNFFAAFYPSTRMPYLTQKKPGRERNYTCAYATYSAISQNHVACVSHLDPPTGGVLSQPIHALAQLNEAKAPYGWEAAHQGHKIFFSGDFNAYPGNPASTPGTAPPMTALYEWYYTRVGGAYASEADGTPNSGGWWLTHPSNAPVDVKIDFIFDTYWTTSRPPLVYLPPTPPAGQFPTLQGNPVSDHWVLHGFAE